MNDTAMTHAGLRASDADRDRDRVADALADALSEGRLSHEEHAERMDAAYAARTLGELSPLTADLPAGAADLGDDSGLVRSPDGTENIRAVLGTATRKGRWLVEPRTNASVLLGSAVLDMREAVLSQREVTVQTALVLGSLEVVVPPGVRVVNRICDVLGAVNADTGPGTEPNPPTVVITGSSWLSAVEVKTKEPKAVERKRRRD
ncbi:DUF1707 SHOCT-like domain-containing protein [Streptomonospora litoralis]|uniref:DUF1707 domain-containing protein n=1 Tax=Streptomonospora litoralis TaxID=2498135 RepID=A0A4P6PZN3_9ACTN|nr:DUF1707 domain-containing protein [Streptomonospora litoralis]QBI51999.1 hypothetical protein EKD16_00910 [Streptomonospora litoralis]